MGIDGAMCDVCVEALAPWMNVPVDPYLLALWTMGGIFITDSDGDLF
jgi:hypothetical protein